MLIAHLPSGYLLGIGINKLTKNANRSILIATVLGSIAPDFDMAYFHLVDGRKTHHHEYFTHWPLFWLGLTTLVGLVVFKVKPSLTVLPLAFGAGALLHMILDTIASPIYWLMPFSNWSLELVSVPAIHQNWIVSFLFHWTFVVELTICVVSAILFYRFRLLAKNTT